MRGFIPKEARLFVSHEFGRFGDNSFGLCFPRTLRFTKWQGLQLGLNCGLDGLEEGVPAHRLT